MDRKSKQKIACMAAGFLIFFVLILFLFFCRIKYEENLIEQQRQELEVIYPEIREELMENFSFYQRKSVKAGSLFFITVLCLSAIYGVGVVLLQKWWQRKKEEQLLENLDQLYEQLRGFLQGDFEIIMEKSDTESSDRWIGIHEKMIELGYYFGDLKERLCEEQNSTKALITDISHQLKTPLAAIRMCHDLSESDDLTEEEKIEFQKIEAKEIHKLETLLDELVKLSRLENNMIQVRPELSDLKSMITEAVSQVFMKAFEKQMEISVEMEKEIQVFLDRKWTVEALVNILENAVKYSEQHTSIMIRVQELQKYVLIEVEDEGMGIAEEELHKIFQRFYRGTRAKEIVKDGAGVGLYLTRSIIEQQGGTILAKRRSDKGTVFKIMFPLV